MTRGLGLLTLLSREERSWRLNQISMVNGLVNDAYVIKPPKNPEGQGLKSFQVGEHTKYLGKSCTQKAGTLLFSSYIVLYISSIWLFLSRSLL